MRIASWIFVLAIAAGPALGQPVGSCDQAKADQLRAKFPPDKVAAMCGVPAQGGATTSTKCVTHAAVCSMSTPAAPGTPCYCTGPHGPDPGTIAP